MCEGSCEEKSKNTKSEFFSLLKRLSSKMIENKLLMMKSSWISIILCLLELPRGDKSCCQTARTHKKLSVGRSVNRIYIKRVLTSCGGELFLVEKTSKFNA